MLLPGGNLFTAFSFAARFPSMVRDAVLLSLAASLGQMVIYFTIKRFGALTYSTIMTTRQFASMLLSSILFLHPISAMQWLGVALVFSALYYQGFVKNHGKPSAAAAPAKEAARSDVIQMETFKSVGDDSKV